MIILRVTEMGKIYSILRFSDWEERLTLNLSIYQGIKQVDKILN
jgi:hypothetical protein